MQPERDEEEHRRRQSNPPEAKTVTLFSRQANFHCSVYMIKTVAWGDRSREVLNIMAPEEYVKGNTPE